MPVLPLLTVLAASPQPPELGKVTWLRDFDAAVKVSRETKKPLLVLFTEVPGCHTVVGFGDEVLSDPKIVETITRDFVPVAVLNNVEGADAKVLRSFNEPSWNNPVVRIMDADRKPLAPRFDGPYSIGAFQRLLTSMRVSTKTEKVTLAAGCFWECEARLGKLDAVRASRVGFLQGDEVVEVEFDTSVMNREQVIAEAGKLGCANRVFTPKEATAIRYSEKDTKYFLRGSCSMEGMTEQEKVRLNAK